VIQQADPSIAHHVDNSDDSTGRRRLPLWALPPVQWVAILVPFVILGWLITGPFDLTNMEEHANTWFESHRTSRLNDLTAFPTHLASTEGIAIVFGLAALFLVIRHRWSSFSLLVWALTAELSLFLVINLIVGRPRPDVVALDSVPRTSSFPSGHVAATFALYGSLALIATLHNSNRLRVFLQWAFTFVAVVAVAFARVYRGAHHVSDVIAGAALGVVCVIVAEHFAFRIAEWLHDRGNVAEATDFVDEVELHETGHAA
jgi:membrane-associated phospholipid phosphatase